MKISIIIVLLMFLNSCKAQVTNSVSNGGIDSRVLSELNSIEEKYIENLKSGNYKAAEAIMSETLTNISSDEKGQFMNQLSTTLGKNETSIIDQYHIQNSAGGLPTTLFSSLDSIGGYVFRVKPQNKEAFLSLRKIQSEPFQFLLTSLYTKYDGEWKLDMIKLGDYSVLNKNAQLLHLEAKKEYKNGNLLNAANFIFVSSQINRPAGNLFQYKNSDKMEDFFNQILEEVQSKYIFPIQFYSVSTKPTIINFIPQTLRQGIIPTIGYHTKIPLSDTIKLKQENTEMHDKISTIFKDIKNNNKYIIYKAMNEIPDGTKEIESYNFVQEITEDNKQR